MPRPCLTLWRPWPWVIAKGGKRVENRTWPPPIWIVGKRLALHVGRHYDTGAFDAIEARLPDVPREPLPGRAALVEFNIPGAIFASATILGAVEVVAARGTYGEPDGPAVGRVIGEIAPERAEDVLADPWTCGPWAWVLEDVRFAERVILAPGRQGIWPLHPSVPFPQFTRAAP